MEIREAVVTFYVPSCFGVFSSTSALHQDLGHWWVGAQRGEQQVKSI